MIENKKRVVLHKIEEVQNYFKEGDCYLVSGEHIRSLCSNDKNSSKVFNILNFDDVNIPVKYHKDGYFEELITGKNIKMAVPVINNDGVYSGLKISGDKIITTDSRIDVTDYIPGIEDGLYLSSYSLYKIPCDKAIINFMNSISDNDEARKVIEDILLSSYRTKKLMEESKQNRINLIKEFEQIREEANSNYEEKKDDEIYEEERVAPLYSTEKKSDISFDNIMFDMADKKFVTSSSNEYLSYYPEKRTLKNRFIGNLKTFKNTLKKVFSAPTKLNKKISGAKHANNTKVYSFKRSNSNPKHGKHSRL